MSRIPVVLEINCGYTRVAIRELTVAGNGTKGGKWVPVDKTKRASKFQHLLESSSYGVPSNYFEAQPKSRPSLFDRKCDEINKAFNKRWHPTKACQLYCEMFTIWNWKKL